MVIYGPSSSLYCGWWRPFLQVEAEGNWHSNNRCSSNCSNKNNMRSRKRSIACKLDLSRACRSYSLALALTTFLSVTAVIASVATADATPEPETLSNIPQTLSGECPLPKDCKKPKIQKPKSRKAETCTIKCVTTCIRGGQGSPGEGPLNVIRPLVVFKQGFRTRQYCWDPSINPKPPCYGDIPNWVGLVCKNDRVWGLRLERMGLGGILNMEFLSSMPALRTLSLMNNTFVGPLPNVKMLTNLRSLYLSYNHFSGQIPDNVFAGLHKLRKVYLANNEFTGKIPSSLATLPSLLILRLDSNKFEGQIPQFQHNNLTIINLSNNDLEGPIPINLRNFDAASFSGNQGLCGPPLTNKCQEASAETTGKMRVLKILLAVIVIALIVAILIAALVICRLRSQSHKHPATDEASMFQGQASNKYVPPVYVKTKSLADHYDASPKKVSGNIHGHGHGHSKRGEQGSKLTFLRHDGLKFDLQDLLKASAEILGSASFGSSYKAVVLDGQAVVVKRYKQMNNVPREEFHEHMRRLGNLNHPNLLPLLAYYYRKEEKLLLSAFVHNGCLASHLHGNHNYQKPGLDWPTRLKIVKGVAKGLAYLYNALPSLTVPHGHLKSSNVLLDESFEPLLTDYALSPVINLDHAQQIIMPYKSPEYAQLGRITKKTDVWSFGILILEILTGKFPENYLTHRHNSDSDIANWVNTMITEKRTSDVFDIEMGGIGNSKAELLKLLKIGLSCCEENVERRLDIKEALEQIEDLKEGENDHGEYSSTLITTERDAYRAV
ncbi:pollen receptor-like kinase 4 isoform X2 [Abrus precatorius]|uniref:non-specific serine/threonine protein kinase n=1 Tax=Abrus precatorius TaxID=3816 RepID=A0A8B8KFF8_ABRPR|nr:pollen receptor-like kinase 4 isoform X2 [Abrus precatorius]